MQQLDPHQRPPEKIKQVYKKYQKAKQKTLDEDEYLIDLNGDVSSSSNHKVRVVEYLESEHVASSFRDFTKDAHQYQGLESKASPSLIPVYEHVDMPVSYLICDSITTSLEHFCFLFAYVFTCGAGTVHRFLTCAVNKQSWSPSALNILLTCEDEPHDEHTPAFTQSLTKGLHIIPSLLPPEIQLLLLDRLLHRDLSNPTHLTNIHTHYNLDYPPNDSAAESEAHPSFFSLPPTHPAPLAHPLDPSVHRPLTLHQLLTRKLRWLTLGGQYDWTSKEYPSSSPPSFPPDISSLLQGLFPHTIPQAAIVNLYSPGDTLSVHRDVAEECGRGLVSVSLGCDAVFVIGTQDEGEEEKVVAMRLRSGSAVYMSGASRFAWHGVPQVVKGTCPDYLRDWPAIRRDDDGEGEKKIRGDEYEAWRGWMEGKRVNVNVRQMWD